MKRISSFVCGALLLTIMIIGTLPARGGQEALLGESFGVAVGIALYDAQAVIGLAADCLAKEIYNGKQVSDMMEEQKRFMALIAEYAKKLIDAPPDNPQGDAHLRTVADTANKISLTADALITYINAPSQVKIAEFLKRKQAAVAALQKMAEGY